jgi:hypothetical protein
MAKKAKPRGRAQPTPGVTAKADGNGSNPTQTQGQAQAIPIDGSGSLRHQREDAQAWQSRAGYPFDDSDLIRRGFKQTCYDYELADGSLLYQQCRYEQPPEAQRSGVDPARKRFSPRRPEFPATFVRATNSGSCLFGPGPRRVIYNWPAVMRAGPGALVFVTEGEKNADDLIKVGLLATTVISHKWTPECVAALTGYELIILEDHDDDGRRLAAAAQQALAPVAKSTRIVPAAHLWKHLGTTGPGLSADVSDWLHRGGDPNQLTAICCEVPAEGVITASPYTFPDEATLPLWDWLYGKHLLRGEVAGTAAMGGTGKSILSIIEALEMASGKRLLHHVPRQPLRVVLINLEDKPDTLDKRIAACMRHYQLTKADIGDRLIRIGKGEIKIKIAKQLRNGDIERNEATINALITFMAEKQAYVLSIDSFVRTHAVHENDNSAIQAVVECFEDIATAANCAVHLWHHTRKLGGDKASVEAARGAQAFIDSCRSVRILETMSRKERDELLPIMPDIGEPGYYFRAFNGKRNFAPPSDQSDWFRFVSVKLRNYTSEFEDDGDDIGVATPWQYPKVELPTITEATREAVLAAIKAGGPWRASARSSKEPWIGVAIASVLCLNLLDPRVKKQVAKLVRELLAAGVLRLVNDPDQHGDTREYVEVAPR